MKTKSLSFKENDIRPDKLLKKQKMLYLQDIRNLVRKKNKFVLISCPACNSSSSTYIYSKYKLNYERCNDCQTVFINPRPTEEILKDYYRNSQNYAYWNDVIFPASEKTRREKIVKPRVNIVIDISKRIFKKIDNLTLIEVGCGYGTFLLELKRRNVFANLMGIEPTPHLANTCRQKGLTIIEDFVENVFKDEIKADIVVNFEVIEHIYSPKKFILACRKILSKNGILITTCPNILGFDLQILGKKSNTIDPEHLNYFNLESLSRLLKLNGFYIESKMTPGMLDAEIVRKAIINNKIKSNDRLLRFLLIDHWKEIGEDFQLFLSQYRLSSHMMLVARKI